MEVYQADLRCEFCGKDFEKRNILKRHLREKHFCGNVYKCNMCAVSFVRKERLIRHLKSVHFDIKFHCAECGMKFVEKYKHNYHMVHSHGYAYCADCKVAYKSVRHSRASHTLEKKNFPVPRRKKRRRRLPQSLRNISISINNSNIRMSENNINVEMKLGEELSLISGDGFGRPGRLSAAQSSLDLTRAREYPSPDGSVLASSSRGLVEVPLRGHVCNNFVIYYKCFLANCQGNKTYNRLNFFIRHLQLEHQISDFKKVKEIIENSTYEKRKTRKKSRIRAKTLEGASDRRQSSFREFGSFRRGFSTQPQFPDPRRAIRRGLRPASKSEPGGHGLSAEDSGLERSTDRGSELSSESQRSDKRGYEQQINPLRARYLSPYDQHSYANPENESKGSLQLKELMHNINIMCMMENNYRKFFSQKKDIGGSIVSRGLEKNDIVLGKRGRPSKSSAQTPCIIPEKMMGSYLASMQSTRDTLRGLKKARIPKPRYRKKRRLGRISESHSREPSLAHPREPPQRPASSSAHAKPAPAPKPRETRKKCPVYADEMFMEVMYLWQKQSTQTPLFYIKRSSVFEQVGERLVCFPGKRHFTRRTAVRLDSSVYVGGPSEFELLKLEKKLARRGKKLRPRNDVHYNFGTFIKTPGRAGARSERLSSAKRPHSEAARIRRRKKKRAKRREGSVDARGRTSHSFCENCGKDFGSFLEFLHHVQTVHQKNVEEVI